MWTKRTPFSGTCIYEEYETESIAVKPVTLEEELHACREQLELSSTKLRKANKKISGLIKGKIFLCLLFVLSLDLETKLRDIKEEYGNLRRRRGLMCNCRGNCPEHVTGKSETKS